MLDKGHYGAQCESLAHPSANISSYPGRSRLYMLTSTTSVTYSPAARFLMVVGQVDGLVQERRNPSALAMELRLSCTNRCVHLL